MNLHGTSPWHLFDFLYKAASWAILRITLKYFAESAAQHLCEASFLSGTNIALASYSDYCPLWLNPMKNTERITGEMLIPDVIKRYPATRALLDRYGLKGCGGPHGPSEPVSWFARLHSVPLDRLLSELNLATTNPASIATPERSIGDTIYRPFFIAGIATALTLGCVWGAINLFTIGLKQNFSSISYSWTPVLRRTMARVVTVEQACRREGVDLNVLLAELQKVSAPPS